MGAFEFQLKYDHKIFDINIEATDWLYSSGRTPGVPGIGGCAATIVTENDIRFGCVSKNPLVGEGGSNGNVNCYDGLDNEVIPDLLIDFDDPECNQYTGTQTGVNEAGVAAIIHVTPEADLVNRITPGNNNGVIRTLLDENCELADIWGHPLADGVDLLGREKLLDGVVTGGIVEDCGDITITVRILEGDMNLDCTVDVLDDQAEASRYGAFFGNLMYQPWYDLEPALKDFDIDIKDLQKVFGRNGSTCEVPIPPQDPQTEPIPQ